MVYSVSSIHIRTNHSLTLLGLTILYSEMMPSIEQVRINAMLAQHRFFLLLKASADRAVQMLQTRPLLAEVK